MPMANADVKPAGTRVVTGLGLELIALEAGTFTMGSPESDPARYDREGPLTKVTITRAFWLGKYEVTHGQWKALMKTDLAALVRQSLNDDTLFMFGSQWQT